MPRPNLRDLPKIRDSLSYLYVERAAIEREGHSVAIKDVRGETHIPAAALAAILLGPGTTISHEGVKVLTESGCSVLWVGEDGVRLYAHGLGGSRSARRLLHQARLHGDASSHSAVVMAMYRMRFAETIPEGLSIEQLRGREGVRVRTAYAQASREHDVPWHGRNYDRTDWGKADPINRALSSGAACLYGVCHAAILTAGYSPALGFIHTGKQLSFVYDIADLYRMETVVPAAFAATAAKMRGEIEGSLEREVRMRCRDLFRERQLLKRVVRDLDSLMKVDDEAVARAEGLFDGLDDGPGFLWNGEDAVARGGVSHGADPGPEGPDEPEG